MHSICDGLIDVEFSTRYMSSSKFVYCHHDKKKLSLLMSRVRIVNILAEDLFLRPCSPAFPTLNTIESKKRCTLDGKRHISFLVHSLSWMTEKMQPGMF